MFDSYAPYKGDISRRGTGSMISFETGESVTYGLFNAQERGTCSSGRRAGVRRYGDRRQPPERGHHRQHLQEKAVDQHAGQRLRRGAAAGAPKQMSLEQCLEFLADDELLEVTPKSLRMRKAILDHEKRMKALHGKK